MGKYTLNCVIGKSGFFKRYEFNADNIKQIVETCYGSQNVEVNYLSKSFVVFEITSAQSLKMAGDTFAKNIGLLFPNINIRFVQEVDGKFLYDFGKCSSIIFSPENEEIEKNGNTEDVNSNIKKEAYDNVLKEINGMIGCDSFKQFAEEFIGIANEMYKHNSIECMRSRNYLISINDGCGLTHIVELLTMMEVHLGIFDQTLYFEFILSENSEGKKICPKDLLEIIYNSDNNGKMICLDISEYLEKSKHSELIELLKEIEHYTNKFNFVFRVPYIEPQELKNIEEILSDILFIKTFSIPPYSDEEIKQYAEAQFQTYGFNMNEHAWKVFEARIREEKSDGRFYGFRTVRKVCDETILLKHQSDLKKGKDDSTITKGDISALSLTFGTIEKNAFDELNEMIGMEKIAERVKEILTQVKTAAANNRIEKPCMHMRFVGAPGTGKTTVARIIGKIFAENDILTNGYFFEYGARDFCGQYVGQTAPKTAAICRDAYGSVLFIDEAYDLYRGGYMTDNDFGREALTTLIAEMENHRDNFVVIMAGYPQPMDILMEGNVGLRSRMPYVIEFPSYTKEQLVAIFMFMAKKGFSCNEDLEPCVKEYFDALPQSYIDSEEFSNARFVRNLYERTWSKAAMRSQLKKLKTIELNADDFKNASMEKEFSEKLSSTRNKVGF